MSNFFWPWITTAGVLLAMMLAIGIAITKRTDGILIDSRCKISLSRFQVALWSWLVLSTLFTIVICTKSIDIDIPAEVLALMGISAGSVAGAVVVKGVKSAREPDKGRFSGLSAVSRSGLLHTNAVPREAQWIDMFKGEEIVDHKYVDISKVQMFFFTIAAWLGYVWVLFDADVVTCVERTKAVADAGQCIFPIDFENFKISDRAFPALSESIVTLIGISHGGYLTVKAATKTPATPQ